MKSESNLYSLSFNIRPQSFNIATLTDPYYFLDTAYHIAGEILAHSPLDISNAYFRMDLELYEYLGQLIESEDDDELCTIIEEIYRIVINILSDENFKPLLNYHGEILNVRHVLDQSGTYAKFFILFQD